MKFLISQAVWKHKGSPVAEVWKLGKKRKEDATISTRKYSIRHQKNSRVCCSEFNGGAERVEEKLLKTMKLEFYVYLD